MSREGRVSVMSLRTDLLSSNKFTDKLVKRAIVVIPRVVLGADSAKPWRALRSYNFTPK